MDNLLFCTEAEGREHGRRELAAYNPLFMQHVETLLLRDGSEDDFPPLAAAGKGFSREAAAWHLRKFGDVYPVRRSGERTDRVRGREMST
jgi:hypothetical protein